MSLSKLIGYAIFVFGPLLLGAIFIGSFAFILINFPYLLVGGILVVVVGIGCWALGYVSYLMAEDYLNRHVRYGWHEDFQNKLADWWRFNTFLWHKK